MVHRDLKPENIMYATEDEDSILKIVDFGIHTYISMYVFVYLYMHYVYIYIKNKKYIYNILIYLPSLRYNLREHRDLKPENIMYATEDEDSILKIVDFGAPPFAMT